MRETHYRARRPVAGPMQDKAQPQVQIFWRIDRNGALESVALLARMSKASGLALVQLKGGAIVVAQLACLFEDKADAVLAKAQRAAVL